MDNLKEELMTLIDEEVGVGGSQLRYDSLVATGMATVSIVPVTINSPQAAQ